MSEEKKTRETLDKRNLLNYPLLVKMSRVAKKQKLTHKSRTKTVPHKYRRASVKSADSMDSIFTPDTYYYRPSKRVTKSAPCHPISVDGILANPSRVFIERYNEEVKQRVIAASERKLDSLPKNIVSLKDLMEGTWEESEEAKALKKKELTVDKSKITKKTKVTKDVANII